MIAINDPDLTPDQSEAVRRLLAEARHDQPMPPEVITRLDGVLADLHASEVSEGSGDPENDPGLASVTPMRRRSRAPQILLAAAAVVAIGFGVTQVLPTSETPDSAGGSAQDSTSQTAPESSQEDSSQGDSGAENPAPSGESDPDGRYSKNSVREQRKVDRLLDRVPLRDLTTANSSGDRAPKARRSLAGCGPVGLQLGDLRTRALYRGKPVVVVFPPPQEGVREAVLFSCQAGTSADPLTTVTLTGP